ncbi:helix-turn-helix transcriptional regulator [Gemmata sp. G18]|uniref:Helix-turn-helix transcriptional regulator n=1 Tax=Gemmata palustris TaxID=2822762 RepID=A0ABS5BMH1_9BACT|nr:helix-turn-helix transcriptional regulator [Gemmata palustris]MBP3954910.1 helix-turn-helix transcriptional regulator [Gemmata palustris]
MHYAPKPEVPERNTATVCLELGILPETLNKLVRADLFTLPTRRQGSWLVWSDKDAERLRQLIEWKRSNPVLTIIAPLPAPPTPTTEPPKPQRASKPKPLRAPQPKKERLHGGITTTEYRGKQFTVTQLAQHLNMPRRTVSERLTRYGWDANKAFTTPNRKTGSQPKTFVLQGQPVTIAQLAERFGIAINTVTYRLKKHNFDCERAFADKLH